MTKTDELRAALRAKGLNYVGTKGDVHASICLVGEAPGADEDQQGSPFVGASGRELDRMLSESGISSDNCWWTNPYKTRPPDNKLDRLSELGIRTELFIEQFFEELNIYKPTFIIALGATPLGLLCPSTIAKRTGHAEISKWRGSILRSDLLQWEHYVVSCFHPAFIFRAWEERQNAVLCLAKVAEEFQYWKTHSNQLQPLPSPQLISDPGADDVIDYLRRILSSPQETVVSWDIENIGAYRGKYKAKQRNRIPYVIGFSIDTTFGMSIGFGEHDKAKAAQIWTLVDTVLRTKKQVTQNGITHDLPWMSFIGFSPNVNLCHDTMARHHVLWPELSHKLEYQTFQYTRFRYYKDEGKNFTVKEKQKFKKYNCLDAIVTLEIFNEQEKEFISRATSNS